MFLPQHEQLSFTPIHNRKQNYRLRISIFILLESKLEDQRFCTK
jgi:hypothetical protein